MLIIFDFFIVMHYSHRYFIEIKLNIFVSLFCHVSLAYFSWPCVCLSDQQSQPKIMTDQL